MDDWRNGWYNRDSDVCILTGLEEVQALVDDHILRAQTMHASPNISPLEPALKTWEEKLITIQDATDIWFKVGQLCLAHLFSPDSFN